MNLVFKKLQIYYLKLIIISIIYASIMASFDMEYFRDRENYLIYATDSLIILENYLSVSKLVAIFNEPLFLFFNYLLSLIFQPEIILSILVFIASFTLSCIVLKESKKNLIVLLLLFFLLPLCSYTFHLQLVTLRQGLATSLFLFAVHKSDKLNVWLWAAFVSSFIHISFFIIFSALLLHKLFCRNDNSLFKVIFIQLVFSLVMSIGLVFVGSYLGIRQVDEISNSSNSVSGGFFIIWLFIFTYIIYMNKKQLMNKYFTLSIIFLTIYLTSYFTNPVAGRLMGTFVPFILITFGKMKSENSIPLLIFLFCIFLLTFSSSISGGSLTEPFNLKNYIFALL